MRAIVDRTDSHPFFKNDGLSVFVVTVVDDDDQMMLPVPVPFFDTGNNWFGNCYGIFDIFDKFYGFSGIGSSGRRQLGSRRSQAVT